MSRLALVMALALVFVGCSEIGIPVDTPVAPSGIRGTVILGPTCPVSATPGDDNPVPCVTAYAASLVVLDSESAVVARINSGADGKFQVNLTPGEYVVTPATGSDTYPIAQPVSVTVSPGQYVDVEINYDTGIL
ncbi:MAG: hypothetical protein ABIP53_04625 [Candidatus Limnocylindrales bacterium]